MATIFKFGVWTLVCDFATLTGYFSNIKVHLLKVRLDLNSKESRFEDCRDRSIGAVNVAHAASSCSEIDSGLRVVCEMTEHVENGLIVFCGFTVSQLGVAHLFCLSRRAIPIITPITEDSY